jgi:hypothetical protein
MSALRYYFFNYYPLFCIDFLHPRGARQIGVAQRDTPSVILGMRFDIPNRLGTIVRRLTI